MGRGARGSQSHRYKPNKPFNQRVCTAFIPSRDTNLVRLNAFLESRGFAVTEQVEEYRVTIKLNLFSADDKTSIDAILILNENFKFHRLQLPDTKWLVLDTVRGVLDQSAPEASDMRFKISSRSGVSNADILRQLEIDQPETEPTRQLESLLPNANKILTRTRGGNIIGVSREYKERVHFLRHKNITIYERRDKSGDAQSNENRFLSGVKIKLNRGKEFSRTARDGQFASIDENRLELTVWIPVPDLRDQKLCEDFIGWVWKFGRELGDIAL